MEHYVCPRCKNEDKRFIGFLNGKMYCRKCLYASGKLVNKTFIPSKSSLFLKYELTEAQKKLSNDLVENYKNKKNALIYAVTGAGKTELVYELISYCLNRGLHVGFALPRVDIVIELEKRLQDSFLNNSVCSVYKDHSFILEADIVILTTHQLYRYPSYFDLLILDEIDAFPYKENTMLKEFFKSSVRGQYVLMSATIDENDISTIKKDNGTVFKLMQRFHQKPIPLPQFIKESFFPRLQVLFRLRKYLNMHKPVLIFVPEIEIGCELFRFLNIFYKNGENVSSKSRYRKEVIERFKRGRYKYLVTTSILERGVTIKDLQVIVFQADSQIYDSKTLIQIAGRVGRKADSYDGEVILYAKEELDTIKDAIREIKRCNESSRM